MLCINVFLQHPRQVVVWFSNNAVVSINVIALLLAQLVL